MLTNRVRSPQTPCLVVVHALVAGALAMAGNAGAQEFQDLKKPATPLVLQSQGSFTVGGDIVFSDALGTGGSGHIAVNQMYVQYKMPPSSRVPVVMVHGADLSGKSYETTPDGRMGWEEYFVRKGHAVYLPDQVSRARSGFDPTVLNLVHSGTARPSALPSINRFSNESAWTVFRFGSTFGTPYPDEQFPVEAMDELAKQMVPDLNAMLPEPNPTHKALSDLALSLKGAVLMGHSETGRAPLEAALINAIGVRGMIVIEPPGGCGATHYTDEQIATLARLPILVVFGDHLTVEPRNWRRAFENCKDFIARVNAAKGNAKMLHPPELGIRGNSHMIMQDKNNLEIADLILDWIDKNVGTKVMGF
jgi:pimeloyl-ACP methyl ester carboxylesterase